VNQQSHGWRVRASKKIGKSTPKRVKPYRTSTPPQEEAKNTQERLVTDGPSPCGGLVHALNVCRLPPPGLGQQETKSYEWILNRLSPDYLVVGREYAPGSQWNTKIRAHVQPHTTRSTRLRKVTKGYIWRSKNTNIKTHKDAEGRAPGFSHLPPTCCETRCG